MQAKLWPLAILLTATISAPAAAQLQSNIGTPAIGVSDSFYEQFGVNWGFNWNSPNSVGFFNQGGFNSAIPPFGGYTPNGGARGGFRAGPFRFNFVADQGSSRSMNMVSPSLTLPNGFPGSLSFGQQVPFVTGIVPVLGGAPAHIHDRVGRWMGGERPDSAQPQHDSSANSSSTFGNANSSANRGDLSLQEIRQQQADSDQRQSAEYDRLMQLARQCEADGKSKVAEHIYRQAAKLKK